MKKSLYSVLDEKAQTILPIFVAVSDDEAERAVAMSVNPDTVISRYPADFALLRLGDISMSDGTITPCAVPVLVCKLDELVGVK